MLGDHDITWPRHRGQLRLRSWRDATNLADVGQLTAAWLEGTMPTHPGYPGGGPDAETAELVDVLAAANRAGLVTISSQPGCDVAHGPSRWVQRAAVEVLTTESTAHRLTNTCAGVGLTVIHNGPARRRRSYHATAVPVTKVGTHPYTWFGTHLSRVTLRRSLFWPLRAAALAAVYDAHQVAVFDPSWSRNDLLWSTLAAAAAGEPEQ